MKAIGTLLNTSAVLIMGLLLMLWGRLDEIKWMFTLGSVVAPFGVFIFVVNYHHIENAFKSGDKNPKHSATTRKTLGIGSAVDDETKRGMLANYEHLMEKCRGLSQEQKQDKIKAYKIKLGLAEDSDSNVENGNDD